MVNIPGKLSASSYWCVQELAQETSVHPKEFPPCVLQPKSKTGVYLGDEPRVYLLPASAPHLPKRECPASSALSETASPPLTRLPDVYSCIEEGVLRDPRLSGGPLAAELGGHFRRLEVSSPTVKYNAGPEYCDHSCGSDGGPVQMQRRPNGRKR